MRNKPLSLAAMHFVRKKKAREDATLRRAYRRWYDPLSARAQIRRLQRLPRIPVELDIYMRNGRFEHRNIRKALEKEERRKLAAD